MKIGPLEIRRRPALEPRTLGQRLHARPRKGVRSFLARLFGVDRLAARGKFDAAQTTDDNSRHWAAADDLSADAALSASVRKTLRKRARYEAANNCYARGQVNALANDCVGTGPRLQMLTDSDELNAQIEREFAAWARAVKLARKLRVMRKAKAESGEAFAILIANPRIRHRVKLDLKVIEADRVQTPDLSSLQANAVDGVVFDDADNPIEYHVLRAHPGANTVLGASATQYDPVPAESMLHWYDADRPEQHRGLSELTPALPLFAYLRRFTLAVVAAAEWAASHAGIFHTTAPASGESAEVDPNTIMEFERGAGLFAPEGWDLEQLEPRQPAATYEMFKREILSESGRPRLMPVNVVTGDSSRHNYSSGRLDNQVYHRAMKVERFDCGLEILDKLLDRWLAEASVIPNFLPVDSLLLDVLYVRHEWFWDGFGHVDPTKESDAETTRMGNFTSTLADEAAAQGKDWETQLETAARIERKKRELGLPTIDQMAPKVGRPPEPSDSPDSDQEDEAERQQRRRNQPDAAAVRIRAEGDASESMRLAAVLTVKAAAPDDEQPAGGKSGGKPRVMIDAYSGDVIRLGGWGDVVFDLAGMEFDERIVLLADHDATVGGIVGYGKPRIVEGRSLVVEGNLVPDSSAAARAIVALAADGMQFQASVGLSPLAIEEHEGDGELSINGRTVKAGARGLTVIRKSRLRETSILALGADASTATRVAASHATPSDKESAMTFDQWLVANGFDPKNLAAKARTKLEAQWKAETQAAPAPGFAPAPGSTEEEEAQARTPARRPAASASAARAPAIEAAERDAIVAAERKRIELIDAAIAKATPGVSAEQLATLRADAVAGKLEIADLQAKLLDLIREARPKAPAALRGSLQASTQVLTCAAVMQSSAVPDRRLAEVYGAETCDLARRYRRMGIRELMAECCRLEGRDWPGLGATEQEMVRAGFSTQALTNILGSSSNRILQEVYESSERTSGIVAKRLSASDFKTVTGARMNTTRTFTKVGPGGGLDHASLEEDTFTFKLDTYGKIYGLTRQDLINDDLGAFLQLPRDIGYGAVEAVELAFWTLVLANTGSYFASANSNYISGATSALSLAAVGLAVKAIREQKHPKSNQPIMVRPRFLVVPPALEAIALELFKSPLVVSTGLASTSAAKRDAATNIYANQFPPVVVPHLSAAIGISGYSDTAWYLLADPNGAVPAFGLAYLNGQEMPTVEEVDQCAEYLGTAFRGYLDFGVCQVDKRGGVKAAGV